MNEELPWDQVPLGDEPAETAPDMTKVQTMVLSDDWANNPDKRGKMAGKALAIIRDSMLSNPDAKVDRDVYRDGQKVREGVGVHGQSGRLNQAGQEYLERARQVLELASKDENGGLVYNELEDKLEPAPWISEAMNAPQTKGEERFPQFNEWLKERTALDTGTDKAGLSYEDYLDFAAGGGGQKRGVDPNEKKAFLNHLAQSTFDPSTMGDDEMIRIVGGRPVMNPYNLAEIDKMEKAIMELPDFDAGQKAMMLDRYHDTVDANIGEIINTFSAAEAGPLESIFNRPLNNEYEAHAAAGGDGVSFLRQRKDRMSRDSYGVGSEVATKFRDAMMAIGTGATWLAGAGLDVLPGVDGVGEVASRPAQIWGELAEQSSQGYKNQTAFTLPGGIDIKRRDLTELVGQIGSFIALGGATSLATRSAGLKAAEQAAAKGLTLAEAAAAEGGAKAATTLGGKTLNFLKAAGTDPTAYLGATQASGMSFGRTYKQVLDATGSKEEAYKAASIQGVSDGLSALIATGVMNQVAPGMERLLGAKGGKLESSLVQRMRGTIASVKGMKATKDALTGLSPELTKQFVKDIGKSMRQTAAQAGLRGLGPGADILAEGAEEALDEALSDAIQIMVDDSKTWSEDGFKNIQHHWRDYVKAGVLGAIGGAMGSAPGNAKSVGKALFGKDDTRKQVIKEQITDQWKSIVANVDQFQDHNKLANVAGEQAVRVAEVLADPKMSVQEKSRILTAAARNGLQVDIGAQDGSGGLDGTGVAPDTKEGQSSATGTTEGQEKATPGAVLDEMGYKPSAGKEWRTDVKLEEDKPVRVSPGVQITPITIDGRSHAGAKLTTVNPDGTTTERHIGAEEAAKLTVAHNFLSERFADAATDDSLPGADPFYDDWAKETEPAKEPSTKETKAESKTNESNTTPATKPAATTGDAAARTVATDEPGTGAKPAGDGSSGNKAGTGVSDVAPGSGEDSKGTGSATEGEAETEAVEEEEPSKPTLRADSGSKAERDSVVRGIRDILDEKELPELEEADLPESAKLSQNKERYKSDEGVWLDTRTGQIGISPAYLDEVMADDSIEDKEEHIASKVEKLAKGKSIKLQASGKPVEEKPAPSKVPKYFVRKANLEEGKEDDRGGTWSKKEEKPGEVPLIVEGAQSFIYTPAKGKGLPLGVGDIISIEGDPDNVLVLHKVENGQYEFFKFNLEAKFSVDPESKSRLNGSNAMWHKTRLIQMAKDLTDKEGLETLLRGDEKSAVKELKKLIKAVMKEVAPDASDPVEMQIDDEENISTSEHFMQVAFREVEVPVSQFPDGKPQGKATRKEMRPVMEVDYKRTLAVLRSLVGDAPLNPRTRLLAALEAARLLSNWVDEEQIHLLTVDQEKFKPRELEKMITAVAGDTKHPFHDIFRETVKERLSHREPTFDRKNPKAIKSDEETMLIAHEFIRKLHQLRTTGSYSEQANADARRLIRSMQEDTGKDGKGTRLMKTIGELVRRYTERVRKILAMRFFRSKLDPKHLELLDRLNQFYNDANLRGDVDQMREKVTQTMEHRLRTFTGKGEDEIRAVAKKHSEALMQIRDLREIFPAAGMDEIVVVNDNLEMSIHPEIAKWLEGRKEYDVEAMNKALDALNDEDAFQKMWADAYIARQVVEAKEEELEFDPNEYFNWLRGDKFDPAGLMGFILQGAPRDVSKPVLRNAREELARVNDSINRMETMLVTGALRDLQSQDVSRPRGRVALIRAAAKLGVTVDPDGFIDTENYPTFDAFKDAVVNAARVHLFNNPLTDSLVEGQEGHKEFKELVKQRINLTNNITELEKAAKLKPTDDPVSVERYRKFSEYLKAVNDYNARLRSMTDRAIGSFDDYKTENYGLGWQDTRATGEPTGVFEFRERNVPEAVEAGDAFGHDYHEGHLPPGKPGTGYQRNPNKLDDSKVHELIEAHKRAIESNAAYTGRYGRMLFYLADQMHRLPASFDRDLYHAGAGFNLEGTLNEYEQIDYESPRMAFPQFPGMDEMFDIDRRFEKGEAINLGGINNLIKVIDMAEKWIAHIAQRANPDEIIAEMDGRQSPAARANLLLQPRLEGLSKVVVEMKQHLFGQMGQFFETVEAESFADRFARDEQGNLKFKGGISNVLTAFNQRLAPAAGSSHVMGLVNSLRATNAAVSLTRRMVKEFNNANWQRNVEQEAIRTIRDGAYRPDHEEMLQLRDSMLDIPTIHSLEFSLNYMATNASPYMVGSLYASDLLEDLRKLQKGREEMKIANRVKRVNVRMTEQERFDLAEAGDSRAGRAFYQETFIKPVDSGFDERFEPVIPQSYNDLDPDNRPQNRPDTGEHGVTLPDFENDKVTDASTAKDFALRNENDKGMKIWLSKALTFIGFRSHFPEGNIEDSREFTRMVMTKHLSGTGEIPDIVVRGLMGVFPGSNEEGEAFQLLAQEFYDKNPRWSLSRFSSAGSFDPESFLADLLEFKKEKEDKRVEEFRRNAGEQIVIAQDAVMASDLPQDEKDQLARVFKRGMDEGKLGVQDSRFLSEYDIFLGDNPSVSLLLTNMLGRTLVVFPTDKEQWMGQSQVGLRVIPGKDGQPNIVWAPQDSASREEQAAAIHRVLMSYGDDPTARAQVESLAGIIRETFAPAFDVETMEKELGDPLRDVTKEYINVGKTLKIPHFKEYVAKLRESEQKFFVQRALEKFQRISRNEELMSPVNFTEGYGSDVLLVANLLTNPQYKAAFDEVYLGPDEAEESGLSDQAVDALSIAVRRLREVAADYAPYELDDATDANLEDMHEQVLRSFDKEDSDDLEQDTVDEDRLKDPYQLALDQVAIRLGEQESEDFEYPVEDVEVSGEKLQVAQATTREFMREKARARKEDKKDPYNEVLPPSDMVVFNHLARALERAKAVNDLLPRVESPMIPANRKSLKGQVRTRHEILDREPPGSPAGPIFQARNRPIAEDPTLLLVGEANRLNIPNVGGTTTMTLKMNMVRRGMEQSAWLSKVPSVDSKAGLALVDAIRQAQRKNPNSTKVPMAHVEVVLDDALLGEAESLIPNLPMYRQQVMDALRGQDEAQWALEKEMEQAQEVLNKPLRLTAERVLEVEDLQNTVLKEQLAALVGDLARSISTRTHDRAAYETRLANHQIQKRLENEFGKLMPQASYRLNELYRLIRDRDAARARFDVNAETDAVQAMERHIRWFDKSARFINAIVNDTVNDRLKKLGLKDVKVRQHVPLIEGDADTLDFEELQQQHKRLEAGLDPQSFMKPLMDQALEEFTAELAGGLGVALKGKEKGQEREHREKLTAFLKAAQGMTDTDIYNNLDTLIGRMEQGGVMDALIGSLALSTEEGRQIAELKLMTGKELAERDNANWQLENARKKLENMQAQRALQFDTGGRTMLGKYRRVSGIKGADGKNLSGNIQIELIDPAHETFPGMRPRDIAENARAYNNDPNAQRDYYVRREALRMALTEIANDRVDDHYRRIRGTTDTLNGFNPMLMVQEAVRRTEVEDAIVRSRFDQASEVEQQKLRGMTAEAIAFATNGETMAFTKGKDRIKRLRLPSNYRARRDLIGKVFDENDVDGSKIVLLPIDAKQRLMQAFPGRITARNVNRKLENLVLRAFNPVGGPFQASQGRPSFMDNAAEPTGNWMGTGFKLTDGKTMSIVEAGKLFSGEFKKGLEEFVVSKRTNKKLDGDNTRKAMEFYGSLVEKLVHAHGLPEMFDEKTGKPKELRNEIDAVLKAIEDGSFAASEDAMQKFNLIDLFARVFAELEAEQVMAKLVSGLSVQDGTVNQALLRYAHGQDGRMRSRFIKSALARETAMHLLAFIQHGFDGNTGRAGHQAAHKEAQEHIAKEAKKVGRHAKDHAMAYLVAQLDGLSDASGYSINEALTKWYQGLSKGMRDLASLDKLQAQAFSRFGQRFLNANHLDLIRDLPLAKEVVKIIRDSGAMADYGTAIYENQNTTQEEAQAIAARKVIAGLREAFLKETSDGKRDAVENMAKVIREQLGDAYNATAVHRAMLSKPVETPLGGEQHNEWKHDGMTPSPKTYGSVPLRMAYAANPTKRDHRVTKEGKWIPDPADVVSMKNSPFYGGYGRHEKNPADASVLRPISLNGLSAPFNILEDSLYRANVSANYDVIRRMLGRIKSPNGVPVVDPMEASIFTPQMQLRPAYSQDMRKFQVAIAAVTGEVENLLFNDSQIGVVNTGFAEATRFLSSVFIVRALASAQQMWNQTFPPSVFFPIKKLVIGEWQTASDFLHILPRLISSRFTDRTFYDKVNAFTKEVSVYVNFRGVDGQDVARNELKHQLRFGVGKGKAWAGKILKEYENIGEAALNLTIGKGEKVISRAIFLAELLGEMRRSGSPHTPADVDGLLELNSRQIPIAATQMATMKVNDMMGQSDMSKKAMPFQSHSDSPVWSSLLKSLVRFSNHTATTASNLTALLPGLMTTDPDTDPDPNRTRKDAIENMVGTLGQNILFQFGKVHTMVPLLLMAFYMLGGDDEEKAAKKAQKKANDLLAAQKDSNPFVAALKDLLVGPQKELFQSWKDKDASLASAKAELASRVGMELLQAMPVAGVLAGYSPITGMIKPIMNDAAVSAASLTSGVKPAEAWYERDKVGVREHRPNAVEAAANLTAPTSVAYDAVDAAVLAGRSVGEAKPLDIAAYLVSEVLPFLRDYRSARRRDLLKQLPKD